MNHPIPESLQRFATGSSTRQENRLIVAHLLQGCALCARQIRETVRPAVMEGAYENVLSSLNSERSLRPGAWAKLLPFEKQPAPSVPILPQRSLASR